MIWSNKLKLCLSMEKTLISHCCNRIAFLGFLVDTSGVQTMGKARCRTILQRHPATFVRIYANKKKVIERLSRSGFCDKAGESKPNWVVALQPPQSVSRVASIIR